MEVFPKPIFILLQMVPFAAVLLILKYLILEPLLQNLLERDRRTTGVQGLVKDLDAKTEAARARYESGQQVLRAELVEIRAAVLSEAAVLEAEVLAKARSEAESGIQKFRVQLEAEILDAKKDIRGQAQGLATVLGSTILGRDLQSRSSDSEGVS